ncbi:MAG TPA: hypothetical protein VGM54_21240 [Chthoniobacter sp.]|jgi:hypothetical protein
MEHLTFTCPICGAEVPRRAKACPDCGACEKSGWSENRYLDGVHLPEWDERSSSPRRLGYGESKNARQWFGIVVAVLIVIAFVVMTLRSNW